MEYMEAKEEKLTPMMRQYMDMKKEHQDKVLFFRLGDFYEMFNDDALEVSKLLNLTLTHRAQMPMCGIPYHAARNYLKRLLDLGMKVAVCEQFVDLDNPRELAKREVTQVYTPATVVDDEYLDSLSSSYVLSTYVDRKGVHIAWSDISTGEFYIRDIKLEKDYSVLESAIGSIKPKEILVQDDTYFTESEFRRVIDSASAIISKLPSWYFSLKEGRVECERQFSSSALRLFSIGEKDPILCAIGALLGYISDNAKAELPQLRAIERVSDEEYMSLNSAAVRNLEILESLQEGKADGSLFGSVNRTRTSSGARFLKFALLHPLVSKVKIDKRLDWVDALINDRLELDRVRHYLAETSDLERCSVKASMKRSTPRDLVAIAESVSSFFSLIENKDIYLTLSDTDITKDFEAIIELSDEILRAVNKECTNINNPGTIILDGFDEELDGYRDFINHGSEKLSVYLEKLKEETQIQTMKSGENRIIGAYIEVSKGQLDKVPDYFIRRQTLVGGERFTTEKLEEIKSSISASSIDAEKRERTVFSYLQNKTAELYLSIEAMGRIITMLDFYSSLAFLSIEKDYVRPEMKENGDMIITDGRHPVVEDYTGRDKYISNSFSTEKSRFSLITGPNMAGKSTFLREVAIIALLSHIGSFVPAKSAVIPIVDKIFCRVGASDNLSRGESTFLVEMSESAQILRSATERSLVIMDEIGRGTSTQDGMSIAYAIMNYLKLTQSITLFATHYHELTMLDSSGMQLLHMAVKEERNNVIFLRKAEEGVAASSYGIHVARLAGLPKEVIKEATVFQKKHFADYSSFDSGQGNLFAQAEETNEDEKEQIIDEIRSFDVDQSTPLEAMMFLSELKKNLK